MKNFIKSNYNIYPAKIYKNNEKYFFFSNDEKIYIIKTKDSIENLDRVVNISNEIYSKNIPISTFLLTVNGKYYVKKDDYYIMLLKYNSSEELSLSYINKFDSININKIKTYNIINDWENEIDSLEQEMSEYNKEFPLIQESINYFIGFSENAIQLLKENPIDNNGLGHLIDEFNDYEFNNPFNIVKTNKMYDISKYIKYKFYNDYVDYEELFKIIKNCSPNDIKFLLCCLMFQDYYFSDVKMVLLGKKDEIIIKNYIKSINKYNELIKYVKSYIKDNDIMMLEWI